MRFLTASRITGPTVGVSGLLLVIGISGAWYVHDLQKQTSKILDVNVSRVQAAEQLEFFVHQIRHEFDQYRISEDATHLHAALGLRDETPRWRKPADELATTDLERSLLDKITQGFDRFFEQLGAIVEEDAGTISRETARTLSEELLTNEVLNSAHEFFTLNEQKLERINDQNKKLAGRLVWALVLLGTCGAVAGLIAGYGVAQGISRSIFQLSLPIRDVAGKLNEIVGPVSISGNPGLEDLETVMRRISEEVTTVIEQLQDSQREAMRSDQLAAVGQLAAGLAHELRNPLMCIKTLVQSASRNSQSSGLDRRDLEVLDEEITRLETLLQGFLDFAKPANLEKRELDLRELARQTVDFLAPRALRCGLTMNVVETDDPVLIEADAAQIRQVVLNLLLNALDAVSNEGRITIATFVIPPLDGAAPAEFDIANRMLQRDGLRPSAVLQVTDNGPGLPPDDADRIFEPFVSTKETGLGLGLAMCRRIVESHGGNITARNRHEGGAEFSVCLPGECVWEMTTADKPAALHSENE